MSPETKHFSRFYTYIEPVLKIPAIKTYGSLIFTILALIIFIIFAIKPTLNTISNLQKEVEVKKETLAKVTKKNEDLTQARINLENISPEIRSRINAAIPITAEVSQLVKSLEATTQKSQASISALQFQPITIQPPVKSTQDPSLTEISFIYNVEANYETIGSILEDLKANARQLTIDNFTINEVEGNQNLLLSITGKAYYLK